MTSEQLQNAIMKIVSVLGMDQQNEGSFYSVSFKDGSDSISISFVNQIHFGCFDVIVSFSQTNGELLYAPSWNCSTPIDIDEHKFFSRIANSFIMIADKISENKGISNFSENLIEIVKSKLMKLVRE